MIKSSNIVIVFSLSLSLFVFPQLAFAQQSSATTQDDIELVLPLPRDGRFRNTYIETLLKAAVSAKGRGLSIEYYDFPLNQKRLERMLMEEQEVDVAWFAADTLKVTQLDFVHIPLYQGLHGRRLFIINKNNQEKFNQISKVTELAELVALQNQSWSDYTVLKNNGLEVNGELEYDAMSKALIDGLGDYFPRSAITINAELSNNTTSGLTMEKELQLVYPNYYFLFLGNHSPEINELLKSGFDEIYDSGEFQRIFYSFYDDRLDGLNLESRRVIRLQNESLPDDVVESLELRLFIQ